MNDDFEHRIQRQPLRPAPSHWREEILSAARDATASVHAPRPTIYGRLASLHQFLSPLLRPQRAAWASLATLWVVIIALNIAARDNSPRAQAVQTAIPISSETLQALQQQRLLLAELVDRPEAHPINQPKSTPPGPRSQRREASATG